MATEIVVGTQIQRVIEDKNIPNSILLGVNQAIFKNEGIPENIMQKLLNSIGIKGEQLYRFAENGNYIHGMPTNHVMSMTEARSSVETLLTGLEGSPVALDYCRLSKPNLLHMTWMKLVQDYGYDAVTNQLSVDRVMADIPVAARNADEIFLVDIEIVVPDSKYDAYEPGVIDLWGIPPNARATPERLDMTVNQDSLRPGTPIRVRRGISTEYVEVKYCYRRLSGENMGGDNFQDAGTIRHDSFILGPEIFHYDTTALHYQVNYKVGGQIKWWTYQAGSGVYTELDAIAVKPFEVNGTYFPFLYFRYNKQSEVEHKDTEEYRDGKKLAKLLGLDYDDIGEAINENPDIEDVIQAMVIFGVDPDTTNDLDREYLYKYFKLLYETQDTKYKNTTPVGDQRRDAFYGYSDMTDGWNNFSTDISDKRFKMRFKAKGIYKTTKAGKKAGVGKYHSEKGTLRYPYRYQPHWDSGIIEGFKDVPYFSYQYQVASNLYYEYQVVGLEMQYYVYGEHLTTSNELKNILLVPLDRSLVKHLTLSSKEQLYSRSLYFVFNSMEEVKLKWYQTGFGQVLMAIVATVVTVLIQGSDGGSLLAAVMSAGVSSMVAAFIITSLIQMAINQLVTGAFAMVADLLGAEGSLVAAIVIAIAAIYGMYNAGTTNLPWAQQALSASNSLVQQGFVQATENLMEDYAEFQDWAADASKELNQMQSTLTHSAHFSPAFVLGESPTTFYNRSIHAGNIGAVGISAVSSYVDNALRLPRISDTLG